MTDDDAASPQDKPPPQLFATDSRLDDEHTPQASPSFPEPSKAPKEYEYYDEEDEEDYGAAAEEGEVEAEEEEWEGEVDK